MDKPKSLPAHGNLLAMMISSFPHDNLQWGSLHSNPLPLSGIPRPVSSMFIAGSSKPGPATGFSPSHRSFPSVIRWVITSSTLHCARPRPHHLNKDRIGIAMGISSPWPFLQQCLPASGTRLWWWLSLYSLQLLFDPCHLASFSITVKCGVPCWCFCSIYSVRTGPLSHLSGPGNFPLATGGTAWTGLLDFFKWTATLSEFSCHFYHVISNDTVRAIKQLVHNPVLPMNFWIFWKCWLDGIWFVIEYELTVH